MHSPKKNTLLKLFISVLIVFTLSLKLMDHFFLKCNKGFTIWQLYSNHNEYRDWDAETNTNLPLIEIENIFNQPFTYLGKGHQSIVFESADRNYVLKLSLLHSDLRRLGWLKHPLSRITNARDPIESENKQTFIATKQSHAFAFSSLKSASGILVLHMDKSVNFPFTALLTDPLGHTYSIPLKDTFFLLQRKGTLVFPTIQNFLDKKEMGLAKEAIDNLISFIYFRSLNGIKDDDPVIKKNYGFYGTEAFQLDTGKIRQEPMLKNRVSAKEETIAITKPLESWLTETSSELLSHYQNTINRL
ncbi:MAG: hypothetical protein NT065_04390 [Chlamydiae bacterium]|nr:hypothetical protein [Chlamydiota bacterium]